MRRLALLCCLILSVVAAVSTLAARAADSPLHAGQRGRIELAQVASAAYSAALPALDRGDTGQRVKDLQWLLGGHPPSVFSAVRTFGHPPNGVFAARTAAAVAAMKWRLGWPRAYVNEIAGAQLLAILLGRERRPVAWIATGARRQAGLVRTAKAIDACQQRIVSIAESQIGVHEVPLGSNTGPQVTVYQGSTGAYHAPWCASFAQWVLSRSTYGTIANASPGVFAIREWAYGRGLLRSTPERGTLVLFLNSTGHMGIVESVGRYGFTSIEGNYADRVARVYHPFTKYAIAFVYLSRCSILPAPGFQLGGLGAGGLLLGGLGLAAAAGAGLRRKRRRAR